MLLAPFRSRKQSARVVVYSYKLILITIKLYAAIILYVAIILYIAIILYAKIITILLILIRP